MQILIKTVQVVLTIALSLASLGTVHATFPGENGVILSTGHLTTPPYIHVLRTAADGSGNATRLAVGYQPVASPNGRKVAFLTWPQDLNVMNIDGSDQTPMGVSDVNFSAWSPDGTKIAYLRKYGLYTIDVATKAITYIGPMLQSPAESLGWSPLGDQLLVGAYNGSYLVNVSNGQVTQASGLTTGSWFPDGKAFVALTPHPGYCAYRVRLDGSTQSLSACGLDGPVISPDGLTLVANEKQTTTLTTRTLSGEDVKTIPGGSFPDWSRAPQNAMRTTLTNDQWSPAVPVANDSDSFLSEADIAVMPDGAAGGYLRQVVGVGIDGRVYHRAQHRHGAWSPFTVVPGVGRAGSGVNAKRVAIAGALDGSAQVVIVGTNDIVYHAVRYASGSWSGFNEVGGYGGVLNFAARDVAIAIVNSSTSTPGQAHLVVNGLADGAAYHRIRLDDGSWTAWLAIGNSQTQSLAIAFDASTNAYVLATSPSEGVTRRVRNPDGSWNNWVPMATTAPRPLKGVTLALSRSSDTAWVGYVGADGAVWSQAVFGPALTSAWEQPPQPPVSVMPKGRSVSMGYTLNTGLELVAVQARPQ
jgi:hypothetical protein